jgi:hypothetical protein
MTDDLRSNDIDPRPGCTEPSLNTSTTRYHNLESFNVAHVFLVLVPTLGILSDVALCCQSHNLQPVIIIHCMNLNDTIVETLNAA